MGLIAAPRIEQFTQVICTQIDSSMSSDQCRKFPQVQKALSSLNLTTQLIMGTLCIFTTPFWGPFSDRHGRKPVLTLSVGVAWLGELIVLVVLANPETIDYRWLLLSPAVSALLGGHHGGASVMHAYVRTLAQSEESLC